MLVGIALVVLAVSLFTIFYVLAGGVLPWEKAPVSALPGTAGASAGSHFS